MSIRVEIQKRVTALVAGGTFKQVTYTGDVPTQTENKKVPSSVVCNEVNGGMSGSAKTGATENGIVLTNWRFECKAAFDCEVDTSYFLLNELKNLIFSLDGLLVKVIPSGDFKTVHPPRQGAHSGTELMIGLTATTRR